MYGIVHYDTPERLYKGRSSTLKAQLKKNKITPKADSVLPSTWPGTGERPTIVTKMKDAGSRR